MITPYELNKYAGRTIAEICPNGYTTPGDSHGAHFVAHVLGISAATTCRMLGGGDSAGATLRVLDIFPQCPSVGVWRLRPAQLRICLVFITRASNVNVAGKVMLTGPREHVGIFTDGFIWHYSRRVGQVVKETPSQFGRYYPSPDNSMFYGSLP